MVYVNKPVFINEIKTFYKKSTIYNKINKLTKLSNYLSIIN